MKRFIPLLYLLVFSTSSFCQQSDFWQNVRYGGGFGLSFGNTTTIAVSPSAIYDFNNGFALGLGVNYTHSSTGRNTANIYGGSLISLYNVPVVNLQLSGEFEQLFVNRKINTISNNYSYPALYLGVAYRKRYISFGVRYDVLYQASKSVYTSAFSPVVRVFF